MISVDEATARILAQMRPVPAEIVALSEGAGRVLAAPVVARLTQPPADVSAMDGYALRSADGATGSRLRVVGSAPAGHPYAGRLAPGEAVRLFTGSVVPQGADTILIQENALRDGDEVRVAEACRPGQHIRSAGQDFTAGSVLVQAGRRLGARDIGLAAAANYPWLEVHRRPRIAILATGDEITLPGDPLARGGIVSSNAHALAALVKSAGGDPVMLPIARDQTAALSAALDRVVGMDMLVTTGGASVGDHDLVQQALVARGFELAFWKVAMRPGKPLISGRLGMVPVLGLPGNPVSALICAALFLLPAMDILGGLEAGRRRVETAILGAAVPANDGRADHLRATLTRAETGPAVVTPFARQDSGMLRVLADADALILRPPNAVALPQGAPVQIMSFEGLGL